MGVLIKLGKLKTGVWLAIAAGIAALERLLLYTFYRPVIYHDTAGYRRLGKAILDGWRGYDGTRTPGYPLFLSLFPLREHIYMAQLLLGLATTLLFFYIGWRATGKGWWGALAAMLYSLNLQQLFFEANLITESLTTFFITMALAGLAWLLYSDGKRPVVLNLLVVGLASAAAGAAALTRPLFLPLPFVAGFFLLVFWRVRPLVRWSTAAACVLPALVMIGAWVGFIHKNFDRWDLTTFSGYQLVQHTGEFFEYVPDEYALIRDTYIKYRDAQTASTGSPTNAIWDAIPELQQVSGLGFYPLSDLMGKISIQLILHHPFIYLRSVFQSWTWFWKAPFYWVPGQITNPLLQRIGIGLVFAERAGLFLCNLVFLAGSIALLWKRVRSKLQVDLFQYFAIALIWLTSIFQALIDHGDNLRFLVPLQTLLTLVVLMGGIRLLTGRLESRKVIT